MTRISLLAGTVLLMVAGAALAAAGDKPQGSGMIEQIDTNKDGSISKAESVAARTARFDKLDTNKDGFLDKDELKAGWKDHGGRHGHHGMKDADANKDGKITKAEFTAGAGARFDKMDSNKDGVLDEADRKDGGKGYDGKGGRFAELDTNKDGKLSKAEFLAKDPMFERADTNKDGVVSKAEIDAAHDHMKDGPPPAQ